MADVPDRDLKEQALAASIGNELARFGKLLARTIPGLQSAMQRINPEFWTEHNANMTGAIAPNLQQTYTEQGAAMMTELPYLDIDWALFNAEAANWARIYSADLIPGLNFTSEKAVRNAITNYFEQGLTKDQLTKLLTPTFGPKRAEMIAITETTRAAVEGERETVLRLEADDGIFMRPYWLTAFDERVCVICKPRNGKEIEPGNVTMGEYPPAHPRCRCGVKHEVVR